MTRRARPRSWSMTSSYPWPLVRRARTPAWPPATGWRIDIKSETQLAEEEAAYASQEWAEGEWIENEAGEMVWQPAEGGEALSAEQWAVAGEDPDAAGAVPAPPTDGVSAEDSSPAANGAADAGSPPAASAEAPSSGALGSTEAPAE